MFFNLKNVLFVSFLFFISCQKNEEIDTEKSDFLVIEKGFTRQAINEYVTIFSEDVKTDDPLVARETDKKIGIRNTSSDRVYLDRYNKEYGRWVTFNLVNSSSTVQNLILEFKYQRVDGIEAYAFKSDSLTFLGKVERVTPVLARHMPTHDLSVPISINSSDTLQLLIKSSRYSGHHEYSLELWSQLAYTYKSELSKKIILIQVGFYLAIVLFTLIVGLLYKRREILFFSFFIFIYLQLILVFSRYYDGLNYPIGIGLSASSVTSLSVYLTNIAFELFLLAFLRQVVKINPVLKKVLLGILIIIIAQVIPLFLSESIYLKLNDFVPHALSVCVILHAVFVLIATLYYFQKTGRWFLMLLEWPLAITLIFLEVSEIFHLEGYDAVRSIYFWATVVSILFMLQFLLVHFRLEIKTKAKLEKDIGQIKTSMDKIRNSEIERIGRNLHDGVGNTLASVLGYLSKENKSKKILDLLGQAIDETRMISHNLVKHDEGTFSERLKTMIERYNDFSSIYFSFNDLSEGYLEELPSSVQRDIFSMIQEMSTNAIKHSQAENVFLQLFKEENHLEIVFEDDGIGFDTHEAVSGIGLKNLQKRAELMNFPLYVDSSKAGTVITLEVNAIQRNHNR